MTPRFHALDAFRGICAISVVLFHMQIQGSLAEWRFFREAEIFVEFFFILSGFVLAHGYGYKEKLAFSPFLQARIWRLFPLHIVMLLVFIALELGKLLAYQYAGIGFNALPFTEQNHIQEIIPNLFLLQSWFASFDHLSFNYPSWSISIEFYMYLMLYFTVAVLTRIKQVSWVIISLVSLGLLAVKSDVLTPQVIKGLACFFSGATTYILYRKIRHYQLSRFTASSLELLMVIGTIGLVVTDLPMKSVISVLFFSLMVLIFSFEGGLLSKWLLQKPLQYSGKLSYSIYMTHSAVLLCLQSALMVLEKLTSFQFTIMIGSKRYLTFGSESLNNLAVLAVVIMVIIISHFSYHYIELAGQRYNQNKRLKRMTLHPA